MIGKIISHFKILSRLGEGGMGEVYLAQDTELGRKVALKFLPLNYTTDPDIKARFKREARAAAALNHPNIVTVHEVGEHEGLPYLAMEYIEGQSLKDLIESKGLSVKEVIDIAIQLCEGLSKAHQSGIVHRDIKPENMLFDSDDRIKVSDFGLAQVRGATRLTKENSTLGTIYYMSPEQLRGEEVDQRSDIFSCGVVFYEMMTGKLPFPGENEMAVTYAIINEQPEPLARYKAGVSEGLQWIFDKALDKNRRLRYQSVEDMLTDLRREKQNFDKGEQPRLPSLSKRITRPRVLIALAIATILILSLFVFRSSVFQLGQDTKSGLSMAILPLANVSVDSTLDWLEWGIQTLLTTELSRSKALRVVDIRGLMAMNETAPEAGLQRLRSFVTVFARGEIARTAGQVLINIHVVDNTSDEVIKSVDAFVRDENDIHNAVKRLANQIRTSLEIKSAQEHVDEQWLKDITTNSVDAYREFVFGHERFLSADWLSAKIHYENAIRIDSTFALAYVWLATVYQMLNDYHGTLKCYRNAYSLRHQLSYKEQLFVDIFGAELEEKYSQQIYLTRQIVKIDPESNFWQFILGRAYLKNREYEKAIEILEGQYLRGWPFVYTYYFLAESYAALQQYNKSLDVFQVGLNQHPDFTAFNAWISAIYYALQDSIQYDNYKKEFYKATDSHLSTAPEQYLEAGNGYRHRQLYADAIACYVKGLSVDPDYYEPYYWLGIMYAEVGQYPKAVDNFKQFLSYQTDGAKAEEAKRHLNVLQSKGSQSNVSLGEQKTTN
jgi:serine/threonine protein kinase/uncharacterized protein HemY